MQTVSCSLQDADQTTHRLYLMFYDDYSWGAAAIMAAPVANDGGNVMYMALESITQDNADHLIQPQLSLEQNYPNPFSGVTSIPYSLTKANRVELSIYNIKGQLVKTLVSDFQNSGKYQLTWDGSDNQGKPVSAGIYPYKVSNGTFTSSKKMILLK
jgi:hypothetical protein